MQMTIERPEKDLLIFGKESIQKEITQMLRWMKICSSFRKISSELQSFEQEQYFQELEAIREETWQEFI
jgi:hypothetical protein